MTNNLNANGMSVAPGVVDTIIAIAVEDVEGVAGIVQNAASLRSYISGKASHSGIETTVEDDGKLHIVLHIEVVYGNVLPELAAKVRQSVSDALLVQVGVEVSSIDIFIDGIVFE